MGRGIDSTDLIRAEDFSYTWPGAEQRALDRINAEVSPEEWIVCTGGASCGKSSLAMAFSGLIPHKTGGRISGRILVNGQDSRELSPVRISDTAGISFQFPQGQFFTLSLEEEIAFSLEQRGMDPVEIRRRVQEALEFTGLSGYGDRSPQELSGGELQRASLAILLAQKPSVYLLDEPLAALDPEGRIHILDLLSRIIEEEKASVLMFSKNPLPAMVRADRLWVMKEGHISDCFQCQDFTSSLSQLKESGCHLSQLYQCGKLLQKENILDEPLWNPLQAESLLFGEMQ